jgi:hypothetical protein
LASTGALAVALGPHPHIPDLRVAMGEPRPDHRVGAVERRSAPLWRWAAAVEVPPARRVEALDALAEVRDADALATWESRFAGAVT